MNENRTVSAVIGIITVIAVILWISLARWSAPAQEQSVPTELQQLQAKAREAKVWNANYESRFKKMEAFCGKGNVWTGMPDMSSQDDYGVFGCKDYSKVPDENL